MLNALVLIFDGVCLRKSMVSLICFLRLICMFFHQDVVDLKI
jgi:hypothetical protein